MIADHLKVLRLEPASGPVEDPSMTLCVPTVLPWVQKFYGVFPGEVGSKTGRKLVHTTAQLIRPI